MDAKNIQIPSNIKDPTIRRFIQSLIDLIIDLQSRVEKLENP